MVLAIPQNGSICHGDCDSICEECCGECPVCWDRSSLEFKGACFGNCEEITAEICNTGDGDMQGTVDYEVWYALSGNPKSGTKVYTGTVPALKSESCANLTFNPESGGNYMFKAYQRFCHPGEGKLWSEQCTVDCEEPSGCNEQPNEAGCRDELEPYHGFCRNPACPEETGCECQGETPPPTSPPPSNGGNGGNGGPSGDAGGPWSCGAMKPPAPILLSVTPSTSVDLVWTAVEPVTHYQIAYGLSLGDYLYGVDNTGKVTSYNVGGLDPGADYCFAVRAINDCMPGDLSNEICTGEVLGRSRVLGATTLADTGSFGENLIYLLFIMGSVCSGVGLRLLFPAEKLA